MNNEDPLYLSFSKYKMMRIHMAKNMFLNLFILESNVTNKNAIYQGVEKIYILKMKARCWLPWLGVREEVEWKESPRGHRNRDIGCAAGVLGIEDQIEGKCRTGR